MKTGLEKVEVELKELAEKISCEPFGEHQLHAPQHSELHAQQRQPGRYHQQQQPQDRDAKSPLFILEKAIDEGGGETSHQQSDYRLGTGDQQQ